MSVLDRLGLFLHLGCPRSNSTVTSKMGVGRLYFLLAGVPSAPSHGGWCRLG